MNFDWGTLQAPALVERMIQSAEQAGASDVHLQKTGRSAEVMFRLDGVVSRVGRLEESIADRAIGRLKYLARLKTYQESLPQEGRIDRQDVGTQEDLRVSTYPTVTGEKVVVRLFQRGGELSLAELDLPELARLSLEKVLNASNGLVLLTGPAGSGKTTTIYACLRYLLEQGGRHIITVEDPVECVVPGVMQTEINEPRGLTYSVAARHLMRQDPQVLVIGEIRDEETAVVALRAAMTGHLVISTLHAGSCRGVFERLALMVPDRFAIENSLKLILNQRLVRRPCRACKGKGCESCLLTGYKGRVPVVEWVFVDDATRQQLQLKGARVISPAPSMEVGLDDLVRQGLTTEEESNRLGRI